MLVATTMLIGGVTVADHVAGADSISQDKAIVAQLSAKLAQLSARSEALAERYNTVQGALGAVESAMAVTRAEIAAKRQQIATTTTALSTAIVNAYVTGAADAQFLALFRQNVAKADARKVFEDQVLGDLHRLDQNFQAQKQALDGALNQLAVQRSQKAADLASVHSLLAQNAANVASTQNTLHQVTRRLAKEIIAYEIQQAVAAARRNDAQGVANAVAAAAAVGGQAAANLVTAAAAAVTHNSGVGGSASGTKEGLAALRAAESQIGRPYVWGGSSPSVGFDCSGLTQWSWRQAGFNIPRTAAQQYYALHRVPLNQLRPGDLLFYYNLDYDHQVDHVVMYAGSGPWGTNTIIAAAHSGTNIALAPLFTFGLIGAGRP
jgi:peptidoglycan DL-endopeptidase CwlO